LTGFALYVKESYSATKSRNIGTPHKDIMKIIAEEYKSAKKSGVKGPAPGVDRVDEEAAEEGAEEFHREAVSEAQAELEAQMGSIEIK
jgi:hypothetical protein